MSLNTKRLQIKAANIKVSLLLNFDRKPGLRDSLMIIKEKILTLISVNPRLNTLDAPDI